MWFHIVCAITPTYTYMHLRKAPAVEAQRNHVLAPPGWAACCSRSAVITTFSQCGVCKVQISIILLKSFRSVQMCTDLQRFSKKILKGLHVWLQNPSRTEFICKRVTLNLEVGLRPETTSYLNINIFFSDMNVLLMNKSGPQSLGFVSDRAFNCMNSFWSHDVDAVSAFTRYVFVVNYQLLSDIRTTKCRNVRKMSKQW